jgi:transcriptional regulator with XRE-family HTH domain
LIDMATFPEKLKRLMSDRNLSDEEAARLIGDVSYSKVRRWRLGSAEPSLSEALRTADAFKVKLTSLAHDDEDVTPESDFESKMVHFLIEQLGVEEAVRRLTLASVHLAPTHLPDLVVPPSIKPAPKSRSGRRNIENAD